MLKKLKNIFVVEDDSAPEATKASESTSQPSAAPKSADTAFEVPKSQASKTNATGGKPDSKFVNLLFKAIEDNNIEGFDYLEFKQSVQSLSKVESDEGQRFKNAFAMANSMGLTKTKLFSSAKHYVKVLDNEEKKFAEAFNAQRSKQIQQREEGSKRLGESIKAKEAQIKKLQAEIESEKKKLSTIESDIGKAMAKVEATKEGFYGAYHMVLKQIKDDLDKITNYIS